jgi:uncharacterized protein YdbL (DUF1318 family)
MRLLMLCLGLLLLPQLGFSESMWTIRSRIMDRKDDIEKMKQEKLVGESYDAVLVFLPNTKPTEEQKKLIAAQNADREEAFSALAKRKDKTVLEIIQGKAKEIYEDSPKGFMFLDKEGKWTAKK